MSDVRQRGKSVFNDGQFRVEGEPESVDLIIQPKGPAIDGSVQWFQADVNSPTFNWTSKAPSGAWVQLGALHPGGWMESWGWWNSQ